jgi:glycosyltransferase involved in cell wall biosynthesis
MEQRRLKQVKTIFSRRSFFSDALSGRGMNELIQRLIDEHDFDIVHTEFSHTATLVPQSSAIHILDAHNVEYDNFRRMAAKAPDPFRKIFYQMEYEKFRREEIEVCSRQDALVVTSERDKRLFDKDVPGVLKRVIPNGVDSRFFSPTEGSEDPAGLVFTGMMGYIPNYDGVEWFIDEILPGILQKRPDTKLTIVGKNPPGRITRRASDHVIVTGTVPDVRPYIDRASVYVVPLRMGGGTRLKITEAMAMHKPIVTTSIGCEGIDVVNGVSALIADSPEKFAESVLQLLGDQDLRKKLVRNALELLHAKYEWSVIGHSLGDFYESLMKAESLYRERESTVGRN